MGRGALLTDEERGRIKGLREAGQGIREIARRLKRSTDTVRRVLGSDDSDEHKRMGPESLMSERAVRLLMRTVATGDISVAQLKHELRLDATVRTIQCVLSHVDWTVYSKMENTLPLLKSDKVARKQWVWGCCCGWTHPRFGSASSSQMRKNGTSMGPTGFNITGAIFDSLSDRPSDDRAVVGR